MKNLILYTKPECHLCDEMKVDIKALKEEFKFDLEEVNIENDPVLFEKYKVKIPVLIFEGRIIAKYSIDKTKILKILSQ
ncbi:MAG TPA: glutaredoxin family protein [Ignavibacteria bacterium]|nr:glutaredoxin family protein [Ignavibacteria bacterium]